MRFPTAWATVAAQNVTLKVATVILAVVTLFQLMAILNLATRDPLVIERECFSRVIPAKSAQPTGEEIRSFLFESLPMRFDSDGYLKEGFLSLAEAVARDKEQTTLKQRQMNQKIVISGVKIDGKDVVVNADRLVSIGKIKSALPLNLKVTLEQTNRTAANPYGLIVSSVSQTEEKGDK